MLLTILLLTLGSCSAYPQYATERLACTEEEQGATHDHGSLMLSCNGSVFVPHQCQTNDSYFKLSQVEKAMASNNLLYRSLRKCNQECRFKRAKCYCDTISEVFELSGHQNDFGLFSYTIGKILCIKEKSEKVTHHAYEQFVNLIKQETCEAGLNTTQKRHHLGTNYCVLPDHQCIDMTHFNNQLKTCNPAVHEHLHGENDEESCENVSKMFSKHTNSLASHVMNRTFHFQTCSYGNNPSVQHLLNFLKSSTASVANTVQQSVNPSEVVHFSLGYTKKDGDVVAKNRCVAKDVFRSTLAHNQYLKGILHAFGKCSFDEPDADECVHKSVENVYKQHRDSFSTYFIEKVLGLEACPAESVGQPQYGHEYYFEQMYQQISECQSAASDNDEESEQESSSKCFVEYSTANGSKMVSVSRKFLNSAFSCNGNLAELLGGSSNFMATCLKIKDIYARHGGASDFEDLFNRLIGAEDVTEDFKRQEKRSEHALEWAQSFVDQSSCTFDEAKQSAHEEYECTILDGRLPSNFFGVRPCLKTANMSKTLACNQKLSESLTKDCPNKDKDCVCKTVQDVYNKHHDDFALSLFHRILNLQPCTQAEQYANRKTFEHALDWVRSSVRNSCDSKDEH